MTHHVFGVRHHGPGSARALVAALEALQPDLVLVEGPPDADALIPLVGNAALQPPVAILVYPVEEPRRGVFYPFAVFSPEWQALRWAVAHGVPARFMDLPQSLRLAQDGGPQREPRIDPLEELAKAAGYADSEEWWEQHVEQRLQPEGMFAAVQEAMAALRESFPPPGLDEEKREAHMRREIRAGTREGYGRIAVICGAWHAPALAELGPAKPDDALLKGLPKIKVAATWIPWTHSRLSFRSGYGAGVTSPGWYAHLWASPDRGNVRWAAQAAQLLRSEDLDASSASVIETVRLADALAALRDRPLASLAELRDATLAVLCGGEPEPLQLIRDQLEIGDVLGQVPEDAPAVPLQRDLEAKQRSLRLKASTEVRELDLDLRKETDRERSRLLHRLRLLDVPWGEPVEAWGKAGTFHELWKLQWDPQLALSVVEASVHGQTVESAAGAAAREEAGKLSALPELAALLDRCILAEVEQGVSATLQRIQQQAALHAGAEQLMSALLPLARAARYGDVRGTPAERVLPVVHGLFERALLALPGACASLDDDAAAKMVQSIEHVEEALRLLDDPARRQEWLETLAQLSPREAIHGLVRGRLARLRLDAGALDGEGLHTLSRLALSSAIPAPQAAAWLDGLLRGGALSLLHQDGVWRALDLWLRELSPEAFIEALPLVRRAFSSFASPEKRAMGEKVKGFDKASAQAVPLEADLDPARAALVLPVLAKLLGTAHA